MADWNSRESVLRRLLAFDATRGQLDTELRSLPWDTSITEVVVTRDHLLAVLKRFLAGEITNGDVEWWANAIEARDGIGFAEESESATRSVLYELANPMLTTTLSQERVLSLIALLEAQRE